MRTNPGVLLFLFERYHLQRLNEVKWVNLLLFLSLFLRLTFGFLSGVLCRFLLLYLWWCHNVQKVLIVLFFLCFRPVVKVICRLLLRSVEVSFPVEPSSVRAIDQLEQCLPDWHIACHLDLIL